MKKFLLLGFCGFIFLLLNSCCWMTARTNWQQTCNSDFFTKNQCGTVIVNRCKNLCDKCTFNEPQCAACYSCVTCQKVGGPCVYNDL